VPQVSTRGHFGIDWKLQTRLEDGYGPREFETRGTIPGYHTPDEPDELVMFVHGWRQTESKVQDRFPEQQRAIRAAGANGPVVSFSWDSDSFPEIAGSRIAAEIARRNGAKLASFLAEYARRAPQTALRVIGISMGAPMLPAAAAALHERDSPVTIDSLSLLGAAIPKDTLTVDGTYGAGLTEQVTSTDNFWKADDRVLGVLYRAAALSEPVGSSGLDDDREPAGYTDHRVDYVDSHTDYWKRDAGCMDAVVDAWNRQQP
jgi:esterase/lipase superfamily enzyme